MNEIVLYTNPALTLCGAPAAAFGGYSLGATSELTGVHPAMLLYYCRLGVLEAQIQVGEDEPTFDEQALADVRRVEHYRRHLGVSRRALPLICKLQREGERLHVRLDFLN